ncbi:MAG: hypothetical protein AAGA96_06750 [Verrucomicrobiota bacterium]
MTLHNFVGVTVVVWGLLSSGCKDLTDQEKGDILTLSQLKQITEKANEGDKESIRRVFDYHLAHLNFQTAFKWLQISEDAGLELVTQDYKRQLLTMDDEFSSIFLGNSEIIQINERAHDGDFRAMAMGYAHHFNLKDYAMAKEFHDIALEHHLSWASPSWGEYLKQQADLGSGNQ